MFLISASRRRKMRTSRKSMLIDRPDVPHTLLGRLKKPKWAFWGQTQERAYSLKVILNPTVCVL